MGTWICHLRIAENLLNALPELDETAFTLGNLAPDSGLPNADWTQFDPPKEVTHFLAPGEDEGRIKDLVFYRDYVLPAANNGDNAKYSFLLGYFFHLICDNLWALRVWSSTKSAHADLLAADKGKAVQLIKRDWYGLDQRYVRDNRECLFWRVLMTAPNPPGYLPFVPQTALHQQFDYIRQFYSQPDPKWELDRRYPYLNEASMQRSVDDSVAAILTVWANPEQLATSTANSAVQLLPPELKAEYPAPLGDG